MGSLSGFSILVLVRRVKPASLAGGLTLKIWYGELWEFFFCHIGSIDVESLAFLVRAQPKEELHQIFYSKFLHCKTIPEDILKTTSEDGDTLRKGLQSFRSKNLWDKYLIANAAFKARVDENKKVKESKSSVIPIDNVNKDEEDVGTSNMDTDEDQ